MTIRTRHLETFRDGIRLGRRTFRVRCGRPQGGGFGLGFAWRDQPGELTVSLGPWAATVMPCGVYVGPMAEVLEDDS